MAQVVTMLKDEVLDDLRTIRDYLEANPPKPDQNRRPDVRIGGHRPPPDPALAKLNDLLRVLNQIFAYEHNKTVAAVPDLSRLTKEAADLAVELGRDYKFDHIELPTVIPRGLDDIKGAKGFDRVKEAIILSYRYFGTLEYYLTRAGKDYLRGVVRDKSEELGDAEGLVNLKHNFGERIDPLVGVRQPMDWDRYLKWANDKYRSQSDPIDHVVEYMIEAVVPLYQGGFGSSPRQARLGTSKDLTPFVEIHIRSYVPGDERFSAPGLSRMWTYQVRVPRRTRSKYDEWNPGTEWAPAWAEDALSLPTLRVVESDSISRPGIADFTEGSLYAIDATGRFLCYGAWKFHSALANSEPVEAAGILVAEAGRVVAIDNRSGHYQPTFRQLVTAVKFLHTNSVLEFDAFVSLYVSEHDAMYFTPAEFIDVAHGGLRYFETAAKISEIAQRYGQRLPVPARHVHLIPAGLADFPDCGRGNRWDLMLENMYKPLKQIVNELADFLKSVAPTGRPL